MFRKRKLKGEYGYISSERKRRILLTVVLLAIPLSIYTVAYVVNGTNETVLSVVSIVACLPACASIVSAIMVYTIPPMPEEEYQKIEPHTGTLTMAYEVYLTNYDKNTLLDAVTVCGDSVVGLSTYKKNPDRRESEKHIENVLRADGYSMKAAVLNDVNRFNERLDSLNAHADTLRTGKDPVRREEEIMAHLLHVAL